MIEWVRYFRSDGGETPERTSGVDQVERKMRLEGGHSSMYPSACIGANLMIGLALNILPGHSEMPRGLEMSILAFTLQALALPYRPGCPTCSAKPATA
jgi:hypothetical protein